MLVWRILAPSQLANLKKKKNCPFVEREVCEMSEEMTGTRGIMDSKQNYTKRKGKNRITWNRSRGNKLKSEVASILNLQQAYNNVRLVM